MFVNEMPWIVPRPVVIFAGDTKIFCAIRNEDDYATLQSEY